MSLLQALLCLGFSFLLEIEFKAKSTRENNDFILNKQEMNRILVYALTIYSNKLTITKYSASLIIFNLSKIKKQTFNEFIISNFNFIFKEIENKILFNDLKCDTYNNQTTLYYKLNDDYLDNEYVNKVSTVNLFNSLILLINDIDNKEQYYYCGELYRFIKNTLDQMDYYYNIKAYINVELFLELYYKIAKFLNKVVAYLKNNDFILFLKSQKETDNIKPNIPAESSQDDLISQLSPKEQFQLFIKQTLNIKDINVLRRLLLRVKPMIFSIKYPQIVYKTLKIFYELITILNDLKMEREENENFSAEDDTNVVISSSLGPIAYEYWPAFMFCIEQYNNIKLLKVLFDIFEKIDLINRKFFSESRAIEILEKFEKTLGLLLNQFNYNQVSTIISQLFEFVVNLEISEYNEDNENSTNSSNNTNTDNYSIKYSMKILSISNRYINLTKLQNNMMVDSITGYVAKLFLKLKINKEVFDIVYNKMEDNSNNINKNNLNENRKKLNTSTRIIEINTSKLFI